MKKLGLALIALMLAAVLGAGAAFAEGTTTPSLQHKAREVTNDGSRILRNESVYTGNGAGMTGTGFGTIGTTNVPPYGASNGYSNHGQAYNSPTPTNLMNNYGGVNGNYNTYNRQNYSTYQSAVPQAAYRGTPYRAYNNAGTNANTNVNNYGTGVRTNTYRARAVNNNNDNWGWLGLLGLFGLAGLRNRNERRVDDRSRDRI
ncbi:WGxxGxxG family protein [Gorillibacterium sp. CAU 1737]|uniref:WGxxGxxG family protein n=1 Tax=Gorillibacterium sp. CAU 1737 TaxID=3140362 RepID=UPI003260960A